MSYGVKKAGKTLQIPKEMLTESVIGQVYELEIATEGVSDPQETVNVLAAKIPEQFPTAEVLWVKVEDNTIRLQIRGSPFAWSALLLFLPQILVVVGVVIAFVAVYMVFQAIPSWAWALLVVGAGLIIFAPKIFKPKLALTKPYIV